MKDYIIFVEGATDKAFIENLLATLGIPCRADKNKNVIDIEGWTNITGEPCQNQLLKAERDNKTILIIFDADDTFKDYGGKAKRLNRLFEILDGIASRVNIFLFPDHNSDGDFETLLQRIAHPGHKSIFECWENYSKCVVGKSYNKPTDKSKVREFAAAIDSSVWDKQGFNKSFSNSDVWSLDSPALKPLEEFLKQHLGHLIPKSPTS